MIMKLVTSNALSKRNMYSFEEISREIDRDREIERGSKIDR